MKRFCFAVLILLSVMTAGGCRGEQPPAEQAALPEGTRPRGLVQRAPIHSSLPEFTFVLRGATDDDVSPAHVTRIEVLRGTESAPLQIITGFDAEAPAADDPTPLDVIDMNFDGYNDIRLVEFLGPGPNVPYLNWLYNAQSGRFDSAAALDELTSPQYDAATREIRSEWRDGPARYGVDVYVFRAGALTPLRKETREYSAPGRYRLQVQTFENGVCRVTEQREGSDSP
jgi:hypothetical protein